MLLLVIHGCAGVFWQTPNQLLLYDIVGPADLPSAVRLNATARYLGILVGPALGGVIMLTLGPSHGIIFNTLFYLPMLLGCSGLLIGVMFAEPLCDRRAASPISCRRCVTSARSGSRQSDDAARRAASFLIGNAYQAQMPDFAGDLGHGDPAWPTALCWPQTQRARCLRASRSRRGHGSNPPSDRHHPRAPGEHVAARLRVPRHLYAGYPPAIFGRVLRALIDTMAQTLVQIHAPAEIGGRVLGLFGMAGSACGPSAESRWASHGAAIGIHWSLGLSAAVLLVFLSVLYRCATVVRRQIRLEGSA